MEHNHSFPSDDSCGWNVDLDDSTATMAETGPTQGNFDMDDDDRVRSEHTFGTPIINGGQEVESWQTENGECIPECDETVKPHIGQRFNTVEEGVDFYKRYATVVGFDVRCSTMRKNRDGAVAVKYLLCSREGQTLSKMEGKLKIEEGKTRRRVSNRVGCKAKCGLKLQKDGQYAVNVLEEIHNHRLCSPLGRTFLKINRKLDIGHQAFIANCAKANIGTSKAFDLYKEMAGGFSNIGATCVEFRNCRRDVHARLEEADAQAVIDKYRKKQTLFPSYTFEYDVDAEDQLRRVFWADPTAKKNYHHFGDMVSFDATYRTNRYKLVFVSFTGIDNHKKCVTFGPGLIAKEDIESYSWLLDAFKRAMGKPPSCIITDQDPAMKEAIPQVFPESRHRFCMWHIMTKVGEKVGGKLAKDETFRKALNAVVWDETLGQEEFELNWHAIMAEYGLQSHRWFTQLYDCRSNWIEAYFKEVFMGGLMRTTSRSEAENGVFGDCINDGGTLLEFFTQFESALEMQRHRQARLIIESETSTPSMKTPLLIEQQAASVYTIAIFYDVQAEIYEACFSCKITTKTQGEYNIVYTIQDGQKRTVTVKSDKGKGTVECSCGKYNRTGILCRHVFVVFKHEDTELIPRKYIVSRWTKNAYTHTTNEIWNEQDIIDKEETEGNTVAATLWKEFYSCMTLSKGNPTELKEMLELIQKHKVNILKNRGDPSNQSTQPELLETFYGTQATSIITVKPPKVSKNKGSGKRLKSAREKAIEQKGKDERRCHTCDQPGARHDSRNCPLKPRTKKHKNDEANR